MNSLWSSSRSALFYGYLLNLVISFFLVPVTSNPFDFAAINGTAVSSLSFRTPLFLNWKFGANYAFLNLLEACGGRVLSSIGFTLPAAMHISVKLALVLGSLAAAFCLRKLGQRINSQSSDLMTFLWLISPSVIWVSAGHAQIETVSIGALFGSLVLLSFEQWAWAGMLAGIGIGFEYIPLAAAAAVVVLWLRKTINFGDVLRFSGGLLSALIVCFAPIIRNSIGFASISSGLISHATAQGAQVDLKPGSIWSISGLNGISGSLTSHWYLVFAILSIFVVLISARSRHKNTEIAAVGVILVLSTILDPTTLPQFSVIALAGLLLIGTVFYVPLTFVTVPPILTYISYFLTTSLYVFFEDTDPSVSQHLNQLLPWLPVNYRFSDVLATLSMDMEIVVLVIVVLQILDRGSSLLRIQSRKGFVTKDRFFSMSMTILTCLILFAYLIQPALLNGIFGRNPQQLFDTPYLITQRRAVNFQLNNAATYATFHTEFDSQLISAAEGSGKYAHGAIDFLPRTLYSQPSVGGRLLKPELKLPMSSLNLGTNGIHAKTILIQLLIHNRNWTVPSKVSTLSATSNVGTVTQLYSNYIVPTWASATFSVQLTANQKTLVLSIQNPGCYLNSSLHGNQPWAQIMYGSGTLRYQSKGAIRLTSFSPNPRIQNQSVIVLPKHVIFGNKFKVFGFSELAETVVSVNIAFGPTARLSRRPTTISQWLAGIAYLIVSIGLLSYLYSIALRRKKTRPRYLENPMPIDLATRETGSW